MESRKAWRNRDPSAGEGVLALLEVLRKGLGAQGVGLFDDDRAEVAGGGRRPALNFWDAFDERPCGDIDWDAWYEELRRNQRVETECGCGAGVAGTRGPHHLYGFLLHGRWALLLVAPPALDPGGAAAIASSLTALAAKLPPAKSAEEARQIAKYEKEAEPSTGEPGGGRPVWWVRKLRH